ncbi:MAG: hypothetical protein GY838_00555 [bacterium]|nr:hypothetical protein [bacterium]
MDLYSTGLPMEEVARIFSRLRSQRAVFIADTCFNGKLGGRTIFDAEKRHRNLSDEFLQHVADAGESRLVLAASKADQVAQERTSLGHGVFTYYLLEGLRGAADGDLNREATGQGQSPVFRGRRAVGSSSGGSGIEGHPDDDTEDLRCIWRPTSSSPVPATASAPLGSNVASSSGDAASSIRAPASHRCSTPSTPCHPDR